MNRRTFLAVSGGASFGKFSLLSAAVAQTFADVSQATTPEEARHPVLVRSGFTRTPDGASVATGHQQTVVRSFDSEGRLAAFVVQVGDHEPYTGAPLHVHHEQDEWLYILAGEFVAEVDGKRIRLKTGDSLLMPKKIPHRWSHTGEQHSGAIHLYTPAGLMDVWWDTSPSDNASQTLEQRKAEFEKYGTTLLGVPLTKDEIDLTE